ncbi:hypothetical protein BFJ63_vAg17005 [Fusarium oxysporum f. sp. narcissi]|uniref:Uncharacterized protein n=2 Tax=Fusarium oxysporum TaxID=5507 RepID=A0A4Q2UZY1_FUSOX|nr:hypothetical protein BFJ65_g15056 [Fusarium oxysporum f. sp. cepae]RKK23566.1 hypothetical protein BFJ67_g17104 [Fusarium oxysporum f. sp. cepae]RKK24114.1 hypothetical protein BFJ66_g17223 [Fusarium oxysporum f. sp. cepae]RYC80111.1 hypothetical protein BFJ63_vAg17005 [Fusarium oxysporum f. sp. narcissi]
MKVATSDSCRIFEGRSAWWFSSTSAWVVYKLEAATVDLVESEHGISIFFVIAVDFFFT